jgi:5-formyltetrahydrofolate cyclo-ligase
MTPAGDERAAAAARAKREARARALAARDALPSDERVRLSALVCARAAALPELRDAATVMLFASFRSEIDTAPLVRSCLGRGKTVALPRVLGPRALEAVRIEDPATDLVPGVWGIPEPRPGLTVLSPETIDAVFLPGVAFSAAGARCGYGGGFYDAFLGRLVPDTPRIALAFEVQVLDEVPCEAHDLTVDAVVTEARLLRPA